jgi:hypothetical protein
MADDDKPHVLDDKEIVVKVLSKAQESVGWYDSRLSKERQRVLGYYNGELPKRQHVGASTYVSTDVYDSVESLKSQLLEVFAGGDHIAQFDPDSSMTAQSCQVATEYASYVIFRENDGYGVFRDVIHDALLARAGIAKVFWDERYEYRDEEFNGLQEHEAMGLAAQDDVAEFDGDVDPITGMVSGKLSRKIDKSQVKIICVPPEEFLISPRAPNMEYAPYVGHRTLKPKSELIAEGYDPKVIMPLHYDDSKGLDLSPEVIERNKPIETAQAIDNPIQPEQELVMVYESYVRMQVDPKKGTRLYKIVHVNEVLLDKQEVDRRPFIIYVPLPIPHLFYGNNFAARVIPYQNAQTVLTRAVLDHSTITTNPRWQVVKGGLINPREMLENRLGGIVNVKTPESVTALQYPSLNPFIFQVMGTLQSNKESSTGISSLSQGLNKDAISKQNSQGLVDQLVNLSSTRQKICARNFAYGFFTQLMLEVIRLAIINEKKKKFIEVAGSVIGVTPEQWTERTTCTVSMHLGYGEKEQTIQQMTAGYAGLAQDPTIGPLFTPQNRYNMLRDIMKLRGWPGAANYLTPPQMAKPPQPDPFKVQEAQTKDKLATAALINAQANQTHEQTRIAVDGTKVHQDSLKLTLNAMEHDRDQDRKDMDTANRINISQREMKLAEQTPQREAYVSPSNA